MIVVRPLTDDDIPILERDLLEINKEEIMAMRGQTLSEIFADDHELKNRSEIIEVDGDIVAVGGSMDTEHGCMVWLFGTTKLANHKKPFALTISRRFEEMKKTKNLLFSYVYSKNELTKQWLKNLGFTIFEGKPVGRNGEIFHRFEWRKECV